jgi:hypothetical protein
MTSFKLTLVGLTSTVVLMLGWLGFGEAESRPAATQRSPTRATALVPDGVPVMGPHVNDPHEGGAHPHPITPDHIRLQNKVAMVEALAAAFDARKLDEVRALLDTERQADPDDVERFQLGYSVLLQCAENPGDESREQARRFFDLERASTLRRRILRDCLNGNL